MTLFQAEALHAEIGYEGEIGGAGLVIAADHPRATDEQVGARGDRSPALATGERVRADVAGEVDAATAQLVERLELHAGDVGDDRIRMRAELGLDDIGGDIRRHGDDDQSRRVVVARGSAGAVVDRETQLRRRGVGEHDVDALGAEGMPDAGAEKARPDDAHRPREPRGVPRRAHAVGIAHSFS